jgi:uncharacterized protein (DUF3820 family)
VAVLGDGKKFGGISSEYLWLLTGTPVLNRPVELYPLLRAIQPGEFYSFQEYAERYCDPKAIQYYGSGRRPGMDYSGASNLAELSQRLEPIMLRRYKADVLDQLPPKFHSYLCLTGKSIAAKQERKRLKEVMMEFGISSIDGRALQDFGSEETSKLFKAALTKSNEKDSKDDGLEDFGSKASGLQSYLGLNEALHRIRHETALSKLEPAVELLEDIILSEKVVVFAHHRALISGLMDHFGDQAVCVVGGMEREERSEAVRRFQEDQDVRIFVGSIHAAGLGLTLTAAAHVVFLELDWSPAVMTQAEDRCHRIGQLNSVRVQYYVIKDTIDEWLAKSLLFKQRNIDQILPEKVGGVETGYVFSFGKHAGLRLEDVPRNYVLFLVKKEVWRTRPDLWRALSLRGFVFEEPPPAQADAKTYTTTEDEPAIQRSSELPLAEVDYVFDFGTHAGKGWREVPQSYIDWLLKEGVWEKRPVLWQALYDAGVVLEEPLTLATTHPDDAQGSTTTVEPTVKPAEHPAAEVDYVFDFGKHSGIQWGEVPMSYRDWLVKEEGIWKKRPVLWRALFEAGVVLEEPPQLLYSDQNVVVKGSTATLESTVEPKVKRETGSADDNSWLQ